MTKSVEDIRQEIDSIDRQIHDLLIRRGEIVSRIGAEKRKAGIQIIRPDREAAKIRSLLDRHTGVIPRVSIARIWREMIGAAGAIQTDVKVTVAIPEHGAQDIWDMARDYFGSHVPMQNAVNPLAAIAMVREGDVNFAVLPWPEEGEDIPWWTYLSSENQDKTLKIVACLPYGGGGHVSVRRAVVVARLAFLSSGQDHSFIFMDIDPSTSRARIMDRLKSIGLNALSIYSRRTSAPDHSLHLVEVDDFLMDNDARLPQLLESFESPDGSISVLGGYPVLSLGREDGSD